MDKTTSVGQLRKLKGPTDANTAVPAGSGMNFPVARLIELFEPAQWEEFTEEWAHSLKQYVQVERWSGPGDMGRDIIGFSSDKKFDGPWDNYQCKRYALQLAPGDIWVELGKIIYYTHMKEFTVPQNYYFIASKGVGLNVQKLLAEPDKLKKGLTDNWSRSCKNKITDVGAIPLEDDLLDYLNKFDFRIFKHKTIVELVAGHANTMFHDRRFGPAHFPARPAIETPPPTIHAKESRYVQQLFEVYSEKLSKQLDSLDQLSAHPELQDHFNRSREVFYYAESLRNFPRDSVDPGAFDEIRDEIYHGVVNTYEMDWPTGFVRMGHTLQEAGGLKPNCNALCIRIQAQDKHGLCHHLANEDRFIWVKKNG
ncbi:MAG: ABC-three component system protein [Acidobacteriaceae bacterium]